MLRAQTTLACLVALTAPAWAQAQAPLDIPAHGSAFDVALDAIDDSAPLDIPAESPLLVVHVHDDFESLASPLRRSLTRRVEGEVEIGAPPPGGVCAATERGHACIAPLEAHDTRSALVLVVGADGHFYETEVVLPAETVPAVRALAIALVDVREAARLAPDVPAAEVGVAATPHRSGESWVYIDREGGLFGRQRSIEPLARPILYLRAVVGFTTAAGGFLFGPGIGLGLCVGDFCAVIEGDVPIIEERRTFSDGRPLSFRPISLAVRLAYRPLVVGPVTAGVTWGLLDRIGNAWRGDTGESQLVNDLGMRQSVEVAITIERPFEFVVEAGLDVTISPARWMGGGLQSVRISDELTGWGVVALRLRP